VDFELALRRPIGTAGIIGMWLEHSEKMTKRWLGRIS
jgi:hypothetical protein